MTSPANLQRATCIHCIICLAISTYFIFEFHSYQNLGWHPRWLSAGSGNPKNDRIASDHHGDWGPFRPSNSWPELLGWSMWTMRRQRRTRWIKWYQIGMAVLRCSKYDDQCIEPVLRLFWYWINSILILCIYIYIYIIQYIYINSVRWVREA